MLYYPAKLLLSAGIIIAISEVAKFNSSISAVHQYVSAATQTEYPTAI